MRICTVLIISLFSAPVAAKTYKCTNNGQVSYQETQCNSSGGELTLPKDISHTQQQQAEKTLKSDLVIREQEKKVANEKLEKERMIRAAEDKAIATQQSAEANAELAKQTQRQADEMNNHYNYNRNVRPYIVINPTPAIPTIPTPVTPSN